MDAPPDESPPEGEVRRIDVAARGDPVTSALRCPFCHDPVRLEVPTPWVACAACLARHHGSCWDESRRCGACGHGLRLRPDTRSGWHALGLLLAAAAGSLLTLTVGVGLLGDRSRPLGLDEVEAAAEEYAKLEPPAPVQLPPTALTPEAPSAPRPESGHADLSHVRVGQRYVFEMPNAMQQLWTVREVGTDFVKFDMAMIMNGDPLGDPTTQDWRYTPPAEGQANHSPPAKVKMSRERVKISSIEFDCLVSEASGYKSWLTMTPGSDTVWTFPGAVKTVQLSDNSVINELKKIEQPR